MNGEDDSLDGTEAPAIPREVLATLEEMGILFDLSRDLIAIAGFDGRFQLLNLAWTNVLGHSREELCRIPFLDFVHPDDREVTATVVARLEQYGRLLDFQNRYRCKDGSYRALAWRATVSLEQRRYYAVARDVSERRGAHETASLLAAIFESSGEAIMVQGLDGTITDWNPGAERLSGYAAAEALGKSMSMLIAAGRTSLPPDFRDQLERTQGFEQMDTVLVHKDGSEVRVTLSVAPLGDGSGHITGAVTLARRA